jgi:hypothetical protein
MVKNTWPHCRRPLFGTALAVVLGAVVSGASARAASCPAWPGEPVPLPTRHDPDPVRARWVELRAEELALRAQALEKSAPLEAHRLWRRLLCLGEGGEEARQGAERTRPVQIHRLRIAAAGGARSKLGEAWASLDQPVAPPPKRRPAENPRQLRAQLLGGVDHWLDRTADLLADARFDTALESAGEIRDRLRKIRGGKDANPRWIRLEVLEATIQVARGEQEAAHACAVRALKMDPDLELDAQRVSPKVVEVFEAAAEGEEGAP